MASFILLLSCLVLDENDPEVREQILSTTRSFLTELERLFSQAEDSAQIDPNRFACTGYDQFVSSIHCQFFHTGIQPWRRLTRVESSLYHHQRFAEFYKKCLRLSSKLFSNIFNLYSREKFMVTLPQEFNTLLYQTLTCIYTISQDADKYNNVLFDTEDGVLVPCDELVEFIVTLQVRSRGRNSA